MRRLMMAIILILISSVAYALPTCWDCINQKCEHKIGYLYLSCWAGPGYCTAGGGECLTLISPENEQSWLIADWDMAGVEVTVHAAASVHVVAATDLPSRVGAPDSHSAEIAQDEPHGAGTGR